MILTVTFNPAIDHTYILDEDIDDGSISRTEKSRFDAGGKGINVSAYLKALGKKTLATGPVGGFTGEFIRSKMEEQQLNYDFVEGGTTRINTTVIADEKEYKINHSGPKTGEQIVSQVIEKIEEEEPAAVVISGSLPPGLDYTAVERIKKEVDSEMVVDLSGDVLGELEGDYLMAKPNAKELTEATGVEVDSVESCAEASDILLERGFQNVVASLGEKGALLSTPDEKFYAEGLEADVVDTTGAGDALLSAVLSKLIDKDSQDNALTHGLAFATLVVETSGTQVPELGKLEEYKEKVNVERR